MRGVRSGRVAVLACSLLLCLARVDRVVGEEARLLGFDSRILPFRSGSMLVVRASAGSIRVAGSSDGEEISVNVLGRAVGAPDEEARLLLDAITLRVGGSGDSVTVVEVLLPERRRPRKIPFLGRIFDRPGAQLEADLTIGLPALARVSIHAERGDLVVRELTGPVTVRLGSGTVLLDEIRGPVRAETDHASIAAEDITGPVSARSSTGPIELRRIAGSVDASGTASGIYITDIKGLVTARSVAGEVTVGHTAGEVDVETSAGAVEVIRSAGPVRVRTRSGDVLLRCGEVVAGSFLGSESGMIRLLLPLSSSGTIEATTETGSISCALPIEIKEITRESLLGDVGGGGAIHSLASRSGAVRIEPPTNAKPDPRRDRKEDRKGG